MKSAEAFIKSKFPEAYAAYQQYKKEEKAKEKAAEKKRIEKEMKNRKDFEDYPLYYYYETSYRGQNSIDLDDAFEKVENAVIDPAGFSGGMSFKEYLNKVAHETEAHFFKRWFDILTGKSNELADIISDSDYRVTQNPVHDGIKLFTRDEVKAFFRKAKYKDK
jgi:hypothetical protein